MLSLHSPPGQPDFNSPDILKGCEMLMGTIFYIGYDPVEIKAPIFIKKVHSGKGV